MRLAGIALASLLASACGQTSFIPKGDLGGHDLAGADLAGPHDLSLGTGRCPTVTLPASLPINYSGDTSGKADLAQSTRLEWGSAPDDALLFVAPVSSNYLVTLVSEPSTNGGFGVSAQDFSSMKVYDESSCPAPGSVATLDGFFVASLGSPGMLALSQGQHALLWVSAATWSSAQSGSYTLSISGP